MAPLRESTGDKAKRLQFQKQAAQIKLGASHLLRAVGQLLRITQEELAEICHLSRQRVNQALQRLSSLGQLRLRYGGIELVAAESLRAFAGRAEADPVVDQGLVAELDGGPALDGTY